MTSADHENDHLLECVDWDFPTEDKRRIIVNSTTGEVVFVNCHWLKRFFANGYDAVHQCDFEDILVAREVGAGELRRLHISTRQGRCAVSPDWDGYANLRDALQKISSGTSSGTLVDDPRILMAAVMAIVFTIVGAAIWFLL